MANQRSLRRRNLMFHMEVDDARSQRVLGQLVDITPKGLRISGEAPLSPGEQYTLHMRLPAQVGGAGALEVRARVKWSKPSEVPGVFSIGFGDLALDRDERRRWQAVIDAYELPEARC